MSTSQHRLAALGMLLLSLSCGAFGAVKETELKATVIREYKRPPAPRLARSAFLARPSITEPTLSPDGQWIAFQRQTTEGSQVRLAAANGGRERAISAPKGITGLYWSHDGQWLWLTTPHQLLVVDIHEGTRSGAVADLAGATAREWLGVDPTQPSAVVVREHEGAIWRLVRFDALRVRTVLTEQPKRIGGYALDADGRLAWLQQTDQDDVVISRLTRQQTLVETARCKELRRCGLWPAANSSEDALLTGDLAGDLRGLLRLEPSGKVTVIAADPQSSADIDTVMANPATGLPAILGFRSVQPELLGLDAATKRAIKTVQMLWPGQALSIDMDARSPDASVWLVGERSATLQGTRWHLLDLATGLARDVLRNDPLDGRTGKPTAWIPEHQLARQTPVSWRASDGMKLRGFVWLPPGVDPGKAPLVTAVHGGPWNHVNAGVYGKGYSSFLANRGYIVFEPNFRGSTGYGRHYLFAAQGDFGNGRVQQDIVEGTRFLLAHGVGDPDRVGIVGASFGGYSALLGVTFQPDLFKVAVAAVPPSDLAWDLQWIGRSAEANQLSAQVSFESMLRILSLDPNDVHAMDQLHRQSPLAHAQQMNRPLTIIASGSDQRVAIRGVLGYVARLRARGKDVQLLVDADAGHTNDEALAAEASLYLMADTLRKAFGTEAEPAPGTELQGYLMRGLKSNAAPPASRSIPRQANPGTNTSL